MLCKQKNYSRSLLNGFMRANDCCEKIFHSWLSFWEILAKKLSREDEKIGFFWRSTNYQTHVWIFSLHFFTIALDFYFLNCGFYENVFFFNFQSINDTFVPTHDNERQKGQKFEWIWFYDSSTGALIQHVALELFFYFLH